MLKKKLYKAVPTAVSCTDFMGKRYSCDAYFSGIAVYESTATSPGSGPILLNNMNCNGSEISVFDCQHSEVEFEECDHNEDVVVSCLTPPKGKCYKCL